MKQLFILFTLIILSNVLHSQTAPEWLWAKQSGGIASGNGIALDSSGNSYVTGYFSFTATFGSTTLTSSDTGSIFIAKLDTNGNYLWAKQAEETGSNILSKGIAIDNNGNCYITGCFNGYAILGTTTLISTGINDMFIAKMDTNGNWLWAKKAGGTGIDDSGNAITVDSYGNSYVAGYFQNTATFGNISLISSGYYGDIFIAKLDTNGNYLWAKQAGGNDYEEGLGIAADTSGNVFVTGYFEGTATFGGTTITSTGGSDVFIAKLDTNGYYLWAKQAGGASNDEGFGIATDINGNVCITGRFIGTAMFGNNSLNSSGEEDIFIAKLDANGNWLWAKKAGGTGEWESGDAIVTDSNGQSYVTGYFEGTATFGTTTLTSIGFQAIFIAKLNANGDFLWATQSGGDGFAIGEGVAIDSSGNCFVTGDFQGTAIFGETTLISNSGAFTPDVIIAKLSSDGVFVTDELSPPATGYLYLSNAYPNPLHRGSSSIIKAEIPPRETGIFTIYNLRGQVVQSQRLTPGSYDFSFPGKELAPGIYFYRLKTTTVNEVKKLILLR